MNERVGKLPGARRRRGFIVAAVTKEPADPSDAPTGRPRDEVRTRIVSVAADLLAHGGRDALTTRAVAEAAGVQAPVLYRLFADKRGLIDAVAEHGFATYLKEKKVRGDSSDPVEDLRAGWDLHVEFGLAHPALYLLMYGDPRPGVKPPAAATAYAILQAHVRRVAAAGLLRVSEEKAANLIHASGCGVVLTLLAMSEDHRDMGLSQTARETVLAAITAKSPTIKSPRPAAAAIALRAVLPERTAALTEAERRLLAEWLDRLAASRRG